MLLGWMVVGAVAVVVEEVLGVWSRMNQFRSIMGRDQPAMLGFVSINAVVGWLRELTERWAQ